MNINEHIGGGLCLSGAAPWDCQNMAVSASLTFVLWPGFLPSILTHFCIQTETENTMKHLRGKQQQWNSHFLVLSGKRRAASQVEEEMERAVTVMPVDNSRLTGLMSNQRAGGPSYKKREWCMLLKMYTFWCIQCKDIIDPIRNWLDLELCTAAYLRLWEANSILYK